LIDEGNNLSPATGLTLDLDNIQGDVIVGLQKDIEYFIFFKILTVTSFRRLLRRHLVRRLTSARLARDRDLSPLVASVWVCG
jgi:Dyp-type peroxidase family protein